MLDCFVQEGYQKRESLIQQQELDIRTFLEMLMNIASHLKKIKTLLDEHKAKEADLVRRRSLGLTP